MLGLFERIGEGLGMVGIVAEGIGVRARYGIENAAISIAEHIPECKKETTSTSDNNGSFFKQYAKTADGIGKFRGKYLNLFESKSAQNPSSISDEEYQKTIDEMRSWLNDIGKDVKEKVSNISSEEQLQQAQMALSAIDEVSKFIFDIRTEVSGAINQKMPIFYQSAVTPLQRQAAEQGSVTAKDIVRNLQGQDIQHANPQGINNPIPTQA